MKRIYYPLLILALLSTLLKRVSFPFRVWSVVIGSEVIIQLLFPSLSKLFILSTASQHIDIYFNPQLMLTILSHSTLVFFRITLFFVNPTKRPRFFRFMSLSDVITHFPFSEVFVKVIFPILFNFFSSILNVQYPGLIDILFPSYVKVSLYDLKTLL